MWSELRARLAPVRDGAAGLAAAAWERACGAAALAVPAVAPFEDAGGAPVLVVAPHPDDEIYGCGGALLRHVDAGDPVTVCMVTDGGRSRSLGLSPAAMGAHRHGESAACAAQCGYVLRWGGLPEGDADEDAMARVCLDALREAAPAVVYAPSCVDFHPEHLKVARALARALAAVERPSLVVRVYGVQVPLTPLLTNRVVDMTDQVERFRRSFESHASQAHHLAASLRVRRQTALLHRAGRHAEAFWEMTPADYVAMQSRGLAGHFRALRPQPFSDPLGYLGGLRTRWRLSRGARPPASPAP
jgi:LmbE family N-acetylglucosaminyl deacetylase